MAEEKQGFNWGNFLANMATSAAQSLTQNVETQTAPQVKPPPVAAPAGESTVSSLTPILVVAGLGLAGLGTVVYFKRKRR